MEDVITFKTAKIAKEKGFDWSCKNFYYNNGELNDNFDTYKYYYVNKVALYKNTEQPVVVKDFNCVAPTQAVLQKWLRETHGIYVYAYVGTYPSESHKGYSDYLIQRKGFSDIRSGMTNTYEEALEEGLQVALNLISA